MLGPLIWLCARACGDLLRSKEQNDCAGSVLATIIDLQCSEFRLVWKEGYLQTFFGHGQFGK